MSDSTETEVKAHGVGQQAHTVVEEIEAKEGYKLDAGLYDNQNLKLAADGHTVLIPQPSDSPEDPLNWPWYVDQRLLQRGPTSRSMRSYIPSPRECSLTTSCPPQEEEACHLDDNEYDCVPPGIW